MNLGTWRRRSAQADLPLESTPRLIPLGKWSKGAGPKQGTLLRLVYLLMFTVSTIEALSEIGEAAWRRAPLPVWSAFAEQYTSWAGILFALPVALIAWRCANGSLYRAAAVVIAGFVAFSSVHLIATFVLRSIIWAGMGDVYSFDWFGEFLFEAGRNLIPYAIILAALSIASSWPGEPTAATPRRVPESSHDIVCLADGKSLVEFDVHNLLALAGGGNYVELMFADGRQVLLRTTMADCERKLSDFGFRRTHKSWLVKLSRVGDIERTRSGDYRLHLGEELQALLSRRNADVLEELRALRKERRQREQLPYSRHDGSGGPSIFQGRDPALAPKGPDEGGGIHEARLMRD